VSRTVYTLLLYLAVPLIVIRLLLRSIRAPRYRQRILERFGLTGTPVRASSSAPLIWVHGVSVGEVVAAKPLVDSLLGRGDHVLITTMTPTGSEQVQTFYGDRVAHSYLPYDLPGALGRFIAKTKPDLLIIMETELWPNLIHSCRRRSIPVLLVNARMSERSARGYQRFAGLVEPMLKSLNGIAAQSKPDQDRLLGLGASPETTRVTGSLKFHVELGSLVPQGDAFFDSMQAANRNVVIAASTREGEEAKVLDAFAMVLNSFPDTLLLLVPRHPERFEAVAKLATKKGFKICRRSYNSPVESSHQVIIGDSMGELMSYYGTAKIAFVGGSLVDTGCQNVLEPAALELPVVVGPSQYNFASICSELENAGALVTVKDQQALGQQILAWLQAPAAALAVGQRGKAVCEANQHALGLVLKLIDASL
jgi:3-deoxy-D-manno-octulosonic-acid transferase